MRVVLGIDVSTTATKAILVDETGAVRGMASSAYGFEQPFPLWREQDPGLWWTAARDAIPRALAAAGVRGEDVTAVGLTGQDDEPGLRPGLPSPQAARRATSTYSALCSRRQSSTRSQRNMP